MSSSVLLCSNRSDFEAIWRPFCRELGCDVRATQPEDFPAAIHKGMGVIVDASSEGWDEDELLTSIGVAIAMSAVPAVHLRGDDMSGVEDLVDDLCNGLVAHSDAEAPRISRVLARRIDRERSERFEFVSVSPRAGDLLAILADGRSLLLRRPVSEMDDGSEITNITLAADARSAVLELQNGRRVTLETKDVRPNGNGNGHHPGPNGNSALALDGARLGARLRELRLAAGLTQAELARRTGIHRPNIARVEAGRHTPSLETLTRLASAIGVSTTRVLQPD